MRRVANVDGPQSVRSDWELGAIARLTRGERGCCHLPVAVEQYHAVAVAASVHVDREDRSLGSGDSVYRVTLESGIW